MDANQDLFGLAACNLFSCMFGGVLVSGSFSRTALAAEVGGRTPLANIYLGKPGSAWDSCGWIGVSGCGV